jgi:carbamate kinase
MKNGKTKETLLVAFGGNALIRKGQEGTVEEQFRNLVVPTKQIARLSRDYRIIITHGNGPQVGHLLIQQEFCDKLSRFPLEILVAQTQGWIGYMIESTLDTELMKLGLDKDQRFVSLLSYVVVDERDPAFKNPSKPIGPILTEEERRTVDYPTVKTHKGYRRVVVSPEPVTIVEKREIRDLIEKDYIVICCGGGGIPVIREGRKFCGVDAVIDKDLASAKLAEEVGVDIFLIATDVPGVAINYGKPYQQFLQTMTLIEAARFKKEGHFSKGSMLPKVVACTRFIRSGGQRALVTALENIERGLTGEAGTEFVR